MQHRALFDNMFKKNKIFSSALIMVHCSNIQIYKSKAVAQNWTDDTRSPGGTVNIQSTTFKENKLSETHVQEYNNDTSFFFSSSFFTLLSR